MRWFAKRGSKDGPGVKLRPPAEPVRVRRVRPDLPEIENVSGDNPAPNLARGPSTQRDPDATESH